MNIMKKRSLLNACLALSFSTFVTQAYGETVIVQAEQFNNSGGTFNDGQPNPVTIYSVNGQGAINWINNGDFVDYNINTIGGEYTVEYLVGTSVAANANIEFFTNANGSWVSQGVVAVPLGSWDNFQPLAHGSTITLPAGSSTIRIQATGANWQWNLESFSLTGGTTDPGNGGNPSGGNVDDVVVNLESFTNTGKVGAPVAGDTFVGFNSTNAGINFNTSGDYADYSVTFSDAGTYSAVLAAGTPLSGDLGAQLLMGSNVIASASIANTGGWDNYVDFDLTGNIVINNPGTYTIRLQSNGSSAWQWNGNTLTFAYESDNTNGGTNDADNDGVNDNLDQCPNTPAGANVDANGCEIVVIGDADNDGVNDNLDQCPNTPAGTNVDASGCEITNGGGFSHNGNGLLWGRVDGATNFLGETGYIANSPNYKVTTDLLETEDAIRGNSTEVFRGEIYDADGNISFYENIDDSVRLYINGNLVLSNDSWADASQTSNLNITPGWNQFELRIGNADGGSGAVAAPGFGIDVNGGTNFVHPSTISGNIFRSNGNVIVDPILPPPGGVVIELEAFDATGTTGRVDSDPNDGFVAGAANVSYVTNGDWGDYNNVFLEAGTYRSFINVSTGSDGSYGARIDINGETASWGYFDHTGGWESPEEVELYGGEFVVETTGNYTLRVEAIGGSDWQWSGDSIRLAKVSDNTAKSPRIYNPNDHVVADIEGPVSGLPFLKKPVQVPLANRLLKSDVWYTYPQNRDFYDEANGGQEGDYANFGATGSFWGHPPEHDFYDEATIIDWTELVQNYQNTGLEYTARGEFDWGFRWVTEYLTNPEPHYVKTLDNRNVRMTFMGYLSYNGYNNNWLSNHSPAFVPHMKSQVDQILRSNPDKLMFDTQTSSTRSTDMRTFGGDFNEYAMENFRVWLDKKYSSAELSAMGINNINTFNYREFLLAQGVTHRSFSNAADRIEGDIPLLEDFIYFNRDVWNQKFAEVLDYIRIQRPDIEIGASTHLFESRGYIFNENITFLSGELNLGARTTISELPTNILVHLKGAEAVEKTLAYFPYPWEFAELRDQNAPRFGRGWVAQSYAYGGLFSIPANVWVGGSTGENTWSPGADNYRDIYQFVRAQEDLLDGYKSYSKVGLVHAMYSSMKAGFIDGGDQIQSSVGILTKDNINFDLLVFGDAGYPVVPRAEDFNKFDHIFYDGDLNYLTAEQRAVLDAQGSKVKHIGQRGTVAGIDINVSVNGSVSNETVSAVSRIHATNANAPYVLHLINRPFAGGVTPTLNGVEITIPQGYFPDNVTSATLHLPNGTSTNLTVNTNGNGDAVVTVNNLEVWGMLELGH